MKKKTRLRIQGKGRKAKNNEEECKVHLIIEGKSQWENHTNVNEGNSDKGEKRIERSVKEERGVYHQRRHQLS